MARYVGVRWIGSLSLVLVLSGCAGRAPQIPPLVHASDPNLSCNAIQAEAALNNERMATLAVEENLKLGQNAIAGVVGFMVWPAWFALDFQNAAGREGYALSQRNAYLATLASDRCSPRPTPTDVAGAPLAPAVSATMAPKVEISTSLVSY